MARFRTRMVRRDGRRCALTLDAADLDSLFSHVETRCQAYVVSARRIEGVPRNLSRTRVRGAILLAALDSLELMLRSGVRVNSALKALADCAPAGHVRRLWTEALRGVEETGSFSGALSQFPAVFSESMIGVIRAHEEAGRLGDGVRQVRDYVAQMTEIRREAVRGMAYPAVVFTAGLGASIVLCVFTLPRFSAMLRDIGVKKTNSITAFFFGLSDVVNHRPLLLAGALAALGSVAFLASLRRFRPFFDRLLLRVPFVGGAMEALAMARICATYSALSESGIRVVDALESCAAVAGNHVHSAGIWRVIETVRDNASVGTGFERAGVFAPEVVLAVKGGDGSLPEVFRRLSSYYAGEAKNRVGLA
ncbi:MAG TPA: type II secretion system F family protein, partial [Opitutaceae bacterium]